MLGTIPTPITVTKILVTIITNRKKGREIFYEQTYHVHYVASMVTILIIAFKMYNTKG
jgi:hypothetical protein